MAIRNHLDLVKRLHATGRYPLTSPETIGTFIEACAVAIFKIDPDIGHIRKAPGRTQFRGHAVDALLSRSTGQSIDLIIGSKAATPEKPATEVCWNVDPVKRYTPEEWFAPEETFTDQGPTIGTGVPTENVTPLFEAFDQDIRDALSRAPDDAPLFPQLRDFRTLLATATSTASQTQFALQAALVNQTKLLTTQAAALKALTTKVNAIQAALKKVQP